MFECDKVFFAESSSGLDEFVEGKIEKFSDTGLAPEAGAFGACHQDKKEVQEEFVVAESLEKAAMEDLAVDPGEALGNRADSIGSYGFSELMKIHDSAPKKSPKVFFRCRLALKLEHCPNPSFMGFYAENGRGEKPCI
jgi:hypothetical protein